jgi:hypothetical protein
VLGWTGLILFSLPALWTWTLLARRARAAPPGKRAEQAKWEDTQRRAPAQICPVLPVESGGIPLGVFRARIELRSAHATTALAAPAHRLALTPEPQSVSEEPAAQHRNDR